MARRTRAQIEGEIAARLVERAKAGDRAAFDELVRRYRGRIYALAIHLTRSESDADDIAQEVFLSAFRALSGFAGRSEFDDDVCLVGAEVARHGSGEPQGEESGAGGWDAP